MERSRSAPSEQYPEKYDAVKYMIKNIEKSWVVGTKLARNRHWEGSSLSDDFTKILQLYYLGQNQQESLEKLRSKLTKVRLMKLDFTWNGAGAARSPGMIVVLVRKLKEVGLLLAITGFVHRGVIENVFQGVQNGLAVCGKNIFQLNQIWRPKTHPWTLDKSARKC